MSGERITQNTAIRQSEYREIRRAIYSGENVRVIGGWGSGKTVLLRRMLQDEHQIFLSGATATANQLSDILATLTAPSTLIVDDAHLLTEEVADMLAASQFKGGPHMVLSHCRSGDLPNPMQRAWKENPGLTLFLRPITAQECAQFSSSIDAGSTSSLQTQLLHRVSGGIVRLLVELQDILLTNVPAEQFAFVRPSVENLGSQNVRFEKVLLHIEALRSELTSTERAAFDTIAISGPIDIDIAEAIVETGGLAGLEHRGLLVVNQTTISLSAEIIETLVERYTTLVQRRHILRTLIIKATATPRTRLPSLESQIALAVWTAKIGGDLGLTRRGLAAALLLPNFEKAIALGTYLLDRDPFDLESAQRLATAYEAVGNHNAASNVSSELRGLNEPVWQQRIRYNNYMAGRDRTSTEIAPQNEEQSTAEESNDGQETNAHRSWFHLFAGELSQAQRIAEGVLNASDATTQSFVWAATVDAIALALLGHGEESLVALDLASQRIRERADEEVNPFADLQLGSARSMVHVRLGQFDRATRVAEEGLRDAIHPLVGAAWHGFIGLAERERGNYNDAISHLNESIVVLYGDPYGLGTVARSELAVCQVMAGAKNDPIDDTEPAGLFRAPVLRNRAWVLASSSSAHAKEKACEVLLSALEWSKQHGQTMHELLVLVDLARFGRAGFAIEHIVSFVRVENPLLRTGSQIIHALYGHSSDLLLEAARQAHTVSWGVAKDELVLLAASGLRQSGQAQRAAQLEVAYNPQIWPTPICRTEEAKLLLTPRERECAILASLGRTSASIAQQRSLSTRTVDNLLSHVYQKCGVASRRELADATKSITGD
jgi:DNA-binding CsgD family transcriptional regulator